MTMNALPLTVLSAALTAPLPMTPMTVPPQALQQAAAPQERAAAGARAEEEVWLDMSFDTMERYGAPQRVLAPALKASLTRRKVRGAAVAATRCGGCGNADALPRPADRILVLP
jgi:hypothetical protein